MLKPTSKLLIQTYRKKKRNMVQRLTEIYNIRRQAILQHWKQLGLSGPPTALPGGVLAMAAQPAVPAQPSVNVSSAQSVQADTQAAGVSKEPHAAISTRASTVVGSATAGGSANQRESNESAGESRKQGQEPDRNTARSQQRTVPAPAEASASRQQRPSSPLSAREGTHRVRNCRLQHPAAPLTLLCLHL